MKKQFTQEEKEEGKILLDNFFGEVREALQDVFVARMHTNKEERLLRLHFPNGQVFVLTVWEEHR